MKAPAQPGLEGGRGGLAGGACGRGLCAAFQVEIIIENECVIKRILKL